MTDSIIQSSLQNPILAGLYASGTSNLSYKSGRIYPALSKSVVGISPNVPITGAPFNSDITFNLPRNGFLDDLLLETVFTFGASGTGVLPDPLIGSMLFSRIEILAQNKVVQTLYPLAIRAEMANLPMEKGLSYAKLMTFCDVTTYQPLALPNPVVATSQRVVYTVIPSSLFRNEKMSLDLTKLEDLQVRCYYNTQLSAGLVNITSVTGVTNRLYMWSHNVEADYYAKLRAENFKSGGMLNMLTWDWFRESLAMTTSATQTSFDIRCNGSAKYTAVAIFDTNGTPQRINSVSFRANGKTLLESIPTSVMSFEEYVRGGGEVSFTVPTATTDVTFPLTFANARNILVIHWDLGENSDEQKGVISLRGLSNPQLVVNHASASAGSVLTLCHKILTITSLGQDGSVTVSTSA